MNAIAEPLSLAPLWERASASFARAVIAVGGPAAIAALGQISTTMRRQIVRWLCPLESIVRKLLLAEAGELHSQNWSAGLLVRTSAKSESKCAAEPARSHLDLSRPETWPARFSLSAPSDPYAVPNARAPRIRALWGPTPPAPLQRPPNSRSRLTDDHAAFRLARRFEALRRVLENPAPHARRLARLMTRAVRRFPEIAMRFATTPARAAGYDPADPRLGIDATGRAIDASAVFRDTS